MSKSLVMMLGDGSIIVVYSFENCCNSSGSNSYGIDTLISIETAMLIGATAGLGTGGQFATLSANLALTANDFLIQA